DALNILRTCDCDSSCYRCLRSYKNKFEHHLLDRHIASGLLESLLDGVEPRLPESRWHAATDILIEDLRRQDDRADFQRNVAVEIEGIGTVVAPLATIVGGKVECIVGITHPLSPDYLHDKTLAEAKEFSVAPILPIDELVIRKNLPHATNMVLGRMGLR